MKTAYQILNSSDKMSLADLTCIAGEAIRLLKRGIESNDYKKKKEYMKLADDYIRDERFEWRKELDDLFQEYDILFDRLLIQIQNR